MDCKEPWWWSRKLLITAPCGPPEWLTACTTPFCEQQPNMMFVPASFCSEVCSNTCESDFPPKRATILVVSNVVWNIHSPKLTKVRYIVGFLTVVTERLAVEDSRNNRRGYTTVAFLTDSTRESPLCCYAVLSQHIVNVAISLALHG